VRIVQRKNLEEFIYYVRPVIDPVTDKRCEYNLLPLVLDKKSVPWGVAAIFIFFRLEGGSDITTCKSLAGDLGAFKEWLDSNEDPDKLFIDFPKMKLRRVTYRYRGQLKREIEAGNLASSTAARRMSSVVSFYRWLINEKIIKPENGPWEERTYNLSLKSEYGRTIKKTVVSTDLQIKSAKIEDPFDETILDEGRLRPLPSREQDWVMCAAKACGNGEMYFILLFMLLTGARVQTVGTLRVRDFQPGKLSFSKSLSGNSDVYKLKAGPGTGIDTKRDKSGVLQIPRELYEALCIYAQSDRSRSRRELAPGGDHDNQYLFLTQQGNPYYAAKEETREFDPALSRRHHKNGGTIRQFLTERLMPYIREHFDSSFSFRLHDLRASFGMNQTDIQMALVQDGLISLQRARANVMALMWHTSSATTDRYLGHRKQVEAAIAAVNGYGEAVQKWIDIAMAGVENR
jgi:integrase